MNSHNLINVPPRLFGPFPVSRGSYAFYAPQTPTSTGRGTSVLGAHISDRPALKCISRCQTWFWFSIYFKDWITLSARKNSAPWRNRIQWVNNGQVFSLMSTGSEYNAPVASRRQSRVFLNSNRDAVRDRTLQIRVEASILRPLIAAAPRFWVRIACSTSRPTAAHLAPDKCRRVSGSEQLQEPDPRHRILRRRKSPGLKEEIPHGGRQRLPIYNTWKRQLRPQIL